MASHKSIHENWLGFFAETTPCVAPASWTNDATWIEHLSCDTSGIKSVQITDPTLEGRAFAVGTRKARKGLRNCAMSVGVKLHGVGVQTADATQVAQTYLGSILQHCMGGVHRGTRHAVVDGDAVEVELAAVTGVIPGCVIAFEDTTSPTEANEGKLHPRTVLAVDADTKVVTLDVALPFTVAAGDIAWPAITPYLVSSTLRDAFAGPTTWQWFVRKEKTDANLLWTVEGSVASLKVDGLGRGALPSLQLDIMGCDFEHGGALTNPNPTTFQGQAQLSMGLDVVCIIGEYNDDTLVTHDATNISFEPGFTRSRVETTTEKIAGTNGTATYSFAPGDTKFSVTLTPYDSAWYDGLEEGKEYCIKLYQPGDGSGAGKGWALCIGRAQLIETPARADLNENHAVNLVFKAMEADNCVGGSNEDIEKTRFTLALF